MEILVRNKNGGGWSRATELKFQDEAMLQNTLYQSPDIIPVEKMGDTVRRPRIFIKEAGLPGSGKTDLIGIDEYGGIMIVECKLAVNREVRRQVIGQVFEYAAYLWKMSYAEFDQMCCKAEKWGDGGLIEVMRRRVEVNGETWDREGFEASVTACLEQGDFRLVVAVDHLNDELKRIIEFLNSRSSNSTQVYALELRQFDGEEVQLLVPDLLAPVVPGRVSGSGGRAPMAEEDFLAAANATTRVLYARLKHMVGDSRIFQESSFSGAGFTLRCGKQRVFLLRAPGCLNMSLGPRHPDEGLRQGTVAEYWAEMFRVRAFEGKREKAEPEVEVDGSWSEADLDQFMSALRVLGDGEGRGT